MRAIICGPRDWVDPWPVICALTIIRAEWVAELNDTDDLPVLVTGGARGADKIAHELAGDGGFEREVHRAEWDRHGKAAGHIRNQKMLDSGVDLVVAMAPRTGLTRGTKDMVTRARNAGVRTLVLVP